MGIYRDIYAYMCYICLKYQTCDKEHCTHVVSYIHVIGIYHWKKHASHIAGIGHTPFILYGHIDPALVHTSPRIEQTTISETNKPNYTYILCMPHF